MMTNIKSHKELMLEQKIMTLVREIAAENGDPTPVDIASLLIESSELKAMHDYANIVSIVRLSMNDHGPVHMKKVCYNAMKIMRLLHSSGIPTSAEADQAGTFSDSLSAVVLASMLHDCGMTIGRKEHELYSAIVVYGLITDILQRVLPGEENASRRVVIRSLAMEGIIGHMGTHPVHSLEAGIILIADGCDMTKGRARVPLEIPKKPSGGDIHKYSAHAIEKVRITAGKERPVMIEILMLSEVGFFQVEEVLMPKIQSSPARQYFSLSAGVIGEEMKQYI